MEPLTDEQIRKMAKARVAFRAHAIVYACVNIFLAITWLITANRGDGTTMAAHMGYYWPIWTHLGWGLGLALHGFFAYGRGADMQAREEAKIRAKYK